MSKVEKLSLDEWKFGMHGAGGEPEVDEETFWLRIAALRYANDPSEDHQRELIMAANAFGRSVNKILQQVSEEGSTKQNG